MSWADDIRSGDPALIAGAMGELEEDIEIHPEMVNFGFCLIAIREIKRLIAKRNYNRAAQLYEFLR